MMHSDAVAVIATYNEAETIGELVDGLLSSGLWVIVVDDDSPDGTAQIASSHGAMVEVRRGQRGIATAYVRALQCGLALDAQYVVQMDAGGTHFPEDAIGMLRVAEAGGFGLVIGSRFLEKGTTLKSHRTVISLAAAWLIRVAGLPVHDATSGFRVWRCDALVSALRAGVRSEGNAFQLELLWSAYRAGARIAEHPIPYLLTNSQFRFSMVKEAMHVMGRIARELI